MKNYGKQRIQLISPVFTAIIFSIGFLALGSYTTAFDGFHYLIYISVIFALLFTALTADADNKTEPSKKSDAYKRLRRKMLRCIYPIFFGIPAYVLILRISEVGAEWGYPAVIIAAGATVYSIISGIKLFKYGGVELPLKFYELNNRKA